MDLSVGLLNSPPSTPSGNNVSVSRASRSTEAKVRQDALPVLTETRILITQENVSATSKKVSKKAQSQSRSSCWKKYSTSTKVCIGLLGATTFAAAAASGAYGLGLLIGGGSLAMRSALSNPMALATVPTFVPPLTLTPSTLVPPPALTPSTLVPPPTLTPSTLVPPPTLTPSTLVPPPELTPSTLVPAPTLTPSTFVPSPTLTSPTSLEPTQNPMRCSMSNSPQPTDKPEGSPKFTDPSLNAQLGLKKNPYDDWPSTGPEQLQLKMDRLDTFMKDMSATHYSYSNGHYVLKAMRMLDSLRHDGIDLHCLWQRYGEKLVQQIEQLFGKTSAREFTDYFKPK